MAQRYGGKFSPKGSKAQASAADPGYSPVSRDPVGARANLMFLPAVALLFTSLFQGALGLVVGLAGAGVLSLGAWLLRGGLQAEAAYHDRKVARRPALPRKILAAIFGCTLPPSASIHCHIRAWKGSTHISRTVSPGLSIGRMRISRR